MIEPLTEIGEATARRLGFNSPERRWERQALESLGRFPTEEARKRIG